MNKIVYLYALYASNFWTSLGLYLIIVNTKERLPIQLYNRGWPCMSNFQNPTKDMYTFFLYTE